MDLLNDAGSLTGVSTPKAILFIQKRKTSYAPNDPGPSVNAQIKALRDLTKKKKTGSIASRMKSTAPGQIGQNPPEVLMGPKTLEEVEAELASERFLKFEVMYNPSSISFQTSAGKHREYRSMGDNGIKQYFSVDHPAITKMSCQLIFQDVNTQDAFMRENLNLNVGNGMDMAANIARKNAGDYYTVKPQVEGLLSLLTMENTRRIIFAWSDVFFHGILESVESNFTMFNKRGDPIKATVDITIRQPETVNQFETDNAYWEGKFKEAFKEKKGGLGDLLG